MAMLMDGAWGPLDQIRHPCLLADWVSLTRGNLAASYASYASHTCPLDPWVV